MSDLPHADLVRLDEPALRRLLEDYTACLRAAFEAGARHGAWDARQAGYHEEPPGFEKWVSERLGTDWVPRFDPKTPDR